jgi:hypothetical protein
VTRQIYLDSSHPPEFELSRGTLYNCHPWRQFTGHQRPRIYYPGINTHYLLQWCQKSARSYWFSRIWNWFWLTDLRANFQILFLSSREDIWGVVAFNGVLIYFGSHLSYLFSRLSIISGFFFFIDHPFYIFPLFLLQLCSSDLLMSLLWLEYYLFVFWFVILDKICDIFHKFVIVFTDLLIIVWTLFINYL